MIQLRRIATITASTALLLAFPIHAQERELDPQEMQIRVTPPALTLKVGDSHKLEAAVVDIGGRPVPADVVFFSRSRRSVRVTREGTVTALRPGEFEVIARVASARRRGPSATITVTIPHPKPARIQFVDRPRTVYTGTTLAAKAAVLDTAGLVRDDLDVELASLHPDVATIDSFGHVTGIAPGQATITASAAGLDATLKIEVLANPIRSIALTADAIKVRTGDVVHFTATGKDANGKSVDGVPIQLSFVARPDDDLGNGATGQIEPDGRFVAEKPGVYTVVASCGGAVAQASIRADARNVQKKAVLLGHGEVFDTHTSDLWVWEGADGRDYAVTGTWGANGDAHFWDVTDPTNMERIATVTVDARTVNDVKVSEDGKICVISREGASNRKNGMVVLDVEDPRNPKVMSMYTANLTGGVHNVFIANKHVYALSAGRRYDIIDIEDPRSPVRVGQYELDTPSHSIHDVWVSKGLAYSSNWRNGIHIVDVGNGIAGGSPSNPVKVGDYAYPSGWNHAAFPYQSERTGKFYVIAGDETFPYGLNTKDKPTYPRGWFHFVDFTDMKNPEEVARYEVPEAGTHNLWVEDDVLYAAYYNGGVRVVDISGELLGDLYQQGREIAWYLPTHKDGYVPNAPMVWGPQPHKGNIFFSDWNSGLWAIKLEENTGRRR